MPPDENRLISDAEWDVLEVLWERERLTARELSESLEETRGWAYSTCKTMLDRMRAKDLVAGRRVGNVWEYTAAVEPVDARRGAWRRFVSAAFGGSLSPALRFIAEDARLTKRQRAQLRKLLEEDPS